MNAIEPGVFIAGQIVPENVVQIASAGIRAIVNNRPDGETPGQPLSVAIAAVARVAGIAYHHAPIAGAVSSEAIEIARTALVAGPTLLFCKSGMRSALLWALVRAGEGRAPDDLVAAARAAGIELGGLRPMLITAGAGAAPVG